MGYEYMIGMVVAGVHILQNRFFLLEFACVVNAIASTDL